MRGAALAAGLVLAAGCFGNREARRLEGRYDLGDPGSGWVRVRPGGADYAWFNEDLSATIYGDSNCATRFDDDLLEDLVGRLTFGLTASDPLLSEPRVLDDRAALMAVVEGDLDGVAVKIGAVVTKKDGCVYDLVYTAPPATFDQGLDAFEAVAGQFRTRSR